ncbi:MAG: cupin domain-containing protein [Candidatus Latescibacteria bacterium]|nr:cupin domain-containing protein [Candidatus Latescibacterota bacterium]
MKRLIFAMVIFTCILAASVAAQAPDYSQLDPKPYDPAVEPDPDLFMASWKESMPRHTHGSLIERDVLTPCTGDPLKPSTRGAVLTNLKRFSHGTLPAGAVTQPNTLEDEQLIFYFYSGKGVMTAGGVSADLYDGVAVLMPPNIEYTFKCADDAPLLMYILTEGIPDGFIPKKQMVVRDENVIPFTSSNVHWSHCYKGIMRKEDGLATLRGLGPVWFNPMTMGQPHSHGEGVEEIWFSLKGDITILLGKQIRKFPPGMAYKIPPNGKTPHSTINVTDEVVKVFWFMN